MSASGSLIGGTFAFIALGFATAVALFFLYRMKKLNKDEVRLGVLRRPLWCPGALFR